MSIITMQTKQPVAYIVYIPDQSLMMRDPLKIERTLRGLENDVSEKMISYSENPRLLFHDTQRLSGPQKIARQTNLQGINEGAFARIILAGSGISAYVREIVRRAYASNVKMTMYVDQDCLLGRYIQW